MNQIGSFMRQIHILVGVVCIDNYIICKYKDICKMQT